MTAMGSDGSHRRARILVQVSDERGRPIATTLSRWLSRVAPMRVNGRVNVALVSDNRVRALNRRYRGVNHATDVLSFPAKPSPQRTNDFLGDIVIARGVARRQAREAGHTETMEIRVLALHGLLHLLGYDHERDSGAMARLERRLRRKGGLAAGLIERQ